MLLFTEWKNGKGPLSYSCKKTEKVFHINTHKLGKIYLKLETHS